MQSLLLDQELLVLELEMGDWRIFAFSGIDSLLSILQMPAGVPVATMAVDGARNAAIFSCKIRGC